MTPPARFDRRSGIGASEIPAIVGVSPWTSEVAVWMDKVGLSTPRRETAAMRTGIALEGAVLGIAADATDRRMTRNRVTFLHPDWPDVPLFGTPDGFTRGRYAVVEVKVVGHHWEAWHDGPPSYVQLQVQGQMAVLPKATHGIVVALLGTDVRTFELERDPETIAAVEADVSAFWATYVIPEVAPPAETDDDRWAIARILAARAGPARLSRIADDDEEVAAARLSALMESRDDVAAQIDRLRLDLAERAEAEDIAGSRWRGSWGERRNVDWSAIAHDLGASRSMVEAHTTTQRVFTFRRSKAADDKPEETT